MALPPAAGSHHTVWVSCEGPGCRPRPVRYSVDGDALVCFGDGALRDVADGTRVRAAIHEIAGGPLLAEFHATARTAEQDEVDPSAFAGLLDHVSLGPDPEHVEQALAEQRASRRVLILRP